MLIRNIKSVRKSTSLPIIRPNFALISINLAFASTAIDANTCTAIIKIKKSTTETKHEATAKSPSAPRVQKTVKVAVRSIDPP